MLYIACLIVDTYKASYKSYWDSLSNRFREGLMNSIVGFERAVTRWEGNYKLSQNRRLVDPQNVSNALLQSLDAAAGAVAVEMQHNLEANE
jgi:transcriptional regulator